jgi:hypothetical protein
VEVDDHVQRRAVHEVDRAKIEDHEPGLQQRRVEVGSRYGVVAMSSEPLTWIQAASRTTYSAGQAAGYGPQRLRSPCGVEPRP